LIELGSSQRGREEGGKQFVDAGGCHAIALSSEYGMAESFEFQVSSTYIASDGGAKSF
jgi:hypothetical protein